MSPTVHYQTEGNNRNDIRIYQDDRVLSMSERFFVIMVKVLRAFDIVHNSSFSITRRPILDTLHLSDLDIMNICCHCCGAFHWLDEHVS